MQNYARPITYGIDLSEQRLIIVRKKRGSKTAVEVMINHPSSAPPDDVQPVLERIQQEQMKGEAGVCAALPNAEASLRWIHTPLTSKSKARSVLPSMLDIQLPFALANCSYDFVDEQINEEGQLSALAVAAPITGINQRIQQLQDNGIDPLQLDHEALALWNQSRAEIPASTTEIRLVGFIQHDHLTLALGTNEKLLYTQTSRTGSDAISHSTDAAIAGIILRINQILRAHKIDPTAHPIHWLWCGALPEGAPWIQPFEAALQADFPNALVHYHNDSETFLARALAGQPYRNQQAQFRKGEILHRDATHYATRRAKRTAAFLALAGIIIGGTALGSKWMIEKRTKNLQTQLMKTAKTISALPHIDKGLERIVTERTWHEQRSKYTPFTRAFEPDAHHLIQQLLAAAHPAGIHYSELTLDENTCTLVGTYTQKEKLAQVTELLEQNGYAVTQAPPSSSSPSRTGFKLIGKRDRES